MNELLESDFRPSDVKSERKVNLYVFFSSLSLDHHIRMKRIDMAIKLDHELRLTRRRSWDMQNFEADLFMMVSRPSEANLGGRKPKYDFSKVTFFCRKLVETKSTLVERVKPEARRGPRRAE